MAPSASKQKRLAEKAAKANAKKAAGGSLTTDTTTTPTESVDGSGISTPLTSRSAAGSQEDLMSMSKLKKATERQVRTVLSFIASIDELLGALLAFLCLIQGVEMSRLTHIRCHFTDACWLKELRSL
jgi:hypothetical protein